MELYEAIEKRRTIRDFEDKPVDMEVIKKILSAGLKAPTNNHLRQWEFVIIMIKRTFTRTEAGRYDKSR